MTAASQILQHPLPYFDARPPGIAVDTIVIHSMYAIATSDPLSPQACFAVLDQNRVAPHYSIARDGAVFQNVAEAARAWHAGVSRMPFTDDTRENVNHFSIGIELIATEDSGYTEAQYTACVQLCAGICSRHPIRNIVGHEHIAPQRKTDPGEKFDWEIFRSVLRVRTINFASLRFADPKS